MSDATVDRTHENEPVDNEVVVTLPGGYVARFFVQGLSDEEYIMRAEMLLEIDNRQKARKAEDVENE